MPLADPLDVGPEGIVGACIESIVSGRPIIWLEKTAKILRGFVLAKYWRDERRAGAQALLASGRGGVL